MVDWAEVRAGLAETRRYLLAHHEPGDEERTYAVAVLGRRERLCARCTGVYPGILAGLLVGLAAVGRLGGADALRPLASTLLVAVLPLPALVDWTATRIGGRSGTNPLRTATGLLLGYAYGLGLVQLLLAGELRVLAVGAGYGLLAAALLWHRRGTAG